MEAVRKVVKLAFSDLHDHYSAVDREKRASAKKEHYVVESDRDDLVRRCGYVGIPSGLVDKVCEAYRGRHYSWDDSRLLETDFVETKTMQEENDAPLNRFFLTSIVGAVGGLVACKLSSMLNDWNPHATTPGYVLAALGGAVLLSAVYEGARRRAQAKVSEFRTSCENDLVTLLGHNYACDDRLASIRHQIFRYHD